MTMLNPLLAQPIPDFDQLERILRGSEEPRRVHLVELLIDDEVLQAITERYLGRPWASRGAGPRWLPAAAELQQRYYQQLIELYYRLGYDYVPLSRIWLHHPAPRRRHAADTAALPRRTRDWVDEGRGLISSWDEFEAFPWDEIEPDLSSIRVVARHLPPGMKITVTASIFEHVLENLLGYESLFYLLHDDPDLVREVFQRWGQKVFEYYAAVITMPEVGAIFHADDLGFKTATLLSPQALRQHVLPWLGKYAALAHEHNKMFWYHCCGNVYDNGLIGDIIEDVEVDAFHSFQDVVLPVTQYKARYGPRMAALGGVDMDKLVRMNETDLRAYVQSILGQCMAGGRFALGSGNSITNYVPLDNYLLLLEEARSWRPS